MGLRGPNKMYIMLQGNHVPGRIRSVPSTRIPGVRHWGIEGMFLDSSGEPTMWHAQKNDVLRCTSYAEFSSDQRGRIEASPQTFSQQCTVIQRLQSINGLPWNLSTSNCEHVVRWAYEGKAQSEQLRTGAAIAVLLGILSLLASTS